jgi:hypothetical protein
MGPLEALVLTAVVEPGRRFKQHPEDPNAVNRMVNS